MDCGYASAAGISRCKASSIDLQPDSSVSRKDSFDMPELFFCAGVGGINIEWLRRDLIALLQKYFNLALGSFQLRAAVVRKLHAFLKQRQRLLERDLALLKLVHDLFKPLQALFKLGHGEIVSAVTSPLFQTSGLTFPVSS